MKKQFLLPILFLTTLFLFSSCNDPIFFTISQEEEILEPVIGGSPTNFVEYYGSLYVASGMTLYKYEGTDPANKGRGIWRTSMPGGRILQLAETGRDMYALCEEAEKKVLKRRTDNSSSWNTISSEYNIFSIYAANNILFLGAQQSNLTYCILYYDGSSFTKLTDTPGHLFNGAAYNGSYILITRSIIHTSGVTYSTDLSATTTINDSILFMGIINLNTNTVAAITRDGHLRQITNTIGSSIANLGDNKLATGALTIWQNNNNKLLLAGRQERLNYTTTSGYTYGYLELELNVSGEITSAFREPGLSNISSINNGENARYKSTIGKVSVNHISQASDGILFVSTQKDGIWSYRERRNGWHWNSEQ